MLFATGTCDICKYVMVSGSIFGVTDICTIADAIHSMDKTAAICRAYLWQDMSCTVKTLWHGRTRHKITTGQVAEYAPLPLDPLSARHAMIQ